MPNGSQLRRSTERPNFNANSICSHVKKAWDQWCDEGMRTLPELTMPGSSPTLKRHKGVFLVSFKCFFLDGFASIMGKDLNASRNNRKHTNFNLSSYVDPGVLSDGQLQPPGPSQEIKDPDNRSGSDQVRHRNCSSRNLFWDKKQRYVYPSGPHTRNSYQDIKEMQEIAKERPS